MIALLASGRYRIAKNKTATVELALSGVSRSTTKRISNTSRLRVEIVAPVQGGDSVPDTLALARLNAKVMTFVADALETAVSSPRTSAANDPVGAPAPVASDEPAPSATEMEEAPASAAPILGGG